MSDVARDASKEFWQPPATQPDSMIGMVEVCDGCGTEFMAGARFCYLCGTSREVGLARKWNWPSYFAFLKVLEFHRVKQGLGLGVASLVAFLAGIGCLLAVLAVSVIYTAQNLADFQAIQSYRTQWLLAAVAAFVAGILLKKSPLPKE